VARVVRGTSLRALNIAVAIALAVALVAIPVYVLLATAEFTLRSVWDLGAIVPVARDSGFGRDWLDLELVLALYAVAAGAALFLDRPEREHRSVVELLALAGRARRRGGRAAPPRPRRPRGAEVAARAVAAAGRRPPGRGRGLARRPDRAPRALALGRSR
jgi:copper transport protein